VDGSPEILSAIPCPIPTDAAGRPGLDDPEADPRTALPAVQPPEDRYVVRCVGFGLPA